MTDILLTAVLPIFAVAAFGFIAGRTKLFDLAMAAVINRFVFYFPLPALSFNLLATARFDQFNWSLLIGYFLSESGVYLLGLFIARLVFKRDWGESILLGVAAAYSNHVLFVLPIALTLFGDAVTLPIIAIIAVDSLFMVGLTMVIMDIMTLGKPSFSAVISRLSKNSTIVALLIGLAFGLLKIELPKGVGVFLSFVSATTAPCALFALGIVLSDSNRSTPIALPMTIIKVIVHPMIAIGTIVLGFQITPEVARPALLVAAGPCGAMAFVMATNYNVRVDAIAKAILFSMVASILSVSLISAY